MSIDVNKLRDRLKSQLAATALITHSPNNLAELSRIGSLSEDELIELAEREGINVADFETSTNNFRWL